MPPTTTSRMAVGLIGALLAASLTGCGGDRPAGPAAGTVAAERCPVTVPRDVGPPGVSPDDFFGWASSYGNGRLWVGGLWPSGVINAGPEYVAKDGSVGMKFGWWRAAPGKLAITGRRLDAPAPPARGFVPDGYGDTGFQASGVDFPTEGCWEVTGGVAHDQAHVRHPGGQGAGIAWCADHVVHGPPRNVGQDVFPRLPLGACVRVVG